MSRFSRVYANRGHHNKPGTQASAPVAASVATVPTWGELKRMGGGELQELAAALGIEYTTRPATMSAINAARQS
jgi:hypothetical protein